MAGHGMVFLYGGFGQGKSLVLKIAVATALKDGKRAAYANLAGVLDDIRSAYDERENKMTELVRRMEWWASLNVLAIDELDKVGQTAGRVSVSSSSWTPDTSGLSGRKR